VAQHAFPATNPHDRLRSTVSALRFLGENTRIPSVFSQESVNTDGLVPELGSSGRAAVMARRFRV